MELLEVIPKDKLESADKGSYFVPYSRLVRMDSMDIRDASNAIDELIQSNPDYEFITYEDPIKNGICIHWRRRV